MTTPSRSSQYPAEFRAALRAAALAPHTAPFRVCATSGCSPMHLRRRFYGFFAALRAEADPEAPLADTFTLMLQDDALVFQPRAATPEALCLAAALAAPTAPPPSTQELLLAKLAELRARRQATPGK
jgi:hypothetical protein